MNSGSSLDNNLLILNRIDNSHTFKLPLKTTQRIKYTCCEVSTNLIVFGASSGGLYVFNRQPCEFVQLLPNKEGLVTQVAISKDEELIGFGTQKGVVCILQKNDKGLGAKLLNKSTEHLGCEITAMEWTSKNQLYFGDNSGKVTSICVSLFVKKVIFQTPPYTKIELDSRIVQINSSDDLLVVSTLTRCYLCDITKEQYRQIGQKPRDGDYGCCIVGRNEKKIFSARPGSRIWEVEINGSVKSTHQLKHSLALPPTLNIIDHTSIEFTNISNKNWPPQSLNFKKLYDIWDDCLLTFTSNSIFIINISNINIVLWNNSYNNVQNVKCIDNYLYVWSGDGYLLVEKIIPLNEYLINCYEQEYYNTCITLIEYYYPTIIKMNNMVDLLYPLVEIDEKLELPNNTKKLIFKIKRINYLKQKFYKLPSGIYTLKKNTYVKKIVTTSKSKSLISIPREYGSKLIPRYKSLPNLSISLDKVKRHQNNSNKQLIKSQQNTYSCPDDNYRLNQVYMDVSMSGIQFVSMTGTDALHDTLLEFGSNVTNKIVQSSKNLKDTLNNLNLYNKNELIPYEVSDTTTYTESSPINEDVVDVSRFKLDFENKDKLNIAPILNFCKQIQSGQKFDEECLQNLIIGVLEVKSNLENVLQVKQPNFPFEQYLKEKHLNIIKKVVKDSFVNDLIIKWAEKYANNLFSVTLFNYPKFLTYYLTPEDFEIDVGLSEFIVLFSKILDIDSLLKFLQENNMKCFYATFNKILQLDPSISGKAEIPILMYLNSMYVFLKLEQIESFCSFGYEKNIKPLFVYYLLIKSSEKLQLDTHNKYNSIFLNYLSDLNSNILNDNNILYYAIYCFIISCHDKNSLCKCGFPLSYESGRFKKLGKMIIEHFLMNNINIDQLNKIFKLVVTDYKSVNCLEDVIKCFCKQVPHLWPVLLESDLKLETPKYSKIILSIQLGLIDQLEIHLQVKNEQMFNKIFTMNYYFKNGLCLSCGCVGKKNKGISWTDIATLALKHLKLEEVKELILKHRNCVPHGDINSWFYQSYVLSSLVEDHYKSQIVETMRSNNMISTIGAMSCENVVNALEEDIGSSVKYKELLSKKSHWGVKIDMKNDFCVWCSLPLNSDPLIRGKHNGLILFKCGHSFHTVCVRHQTDIVQCVGVITTDV
ncbi:uncharacterized protein LOC126894813 isoform X2 [Daktulosphaira vitifoliae]|uniref:uncharacterized protein LOC126894813 isoform X2 n=1 Tax=Daktulosphaira vitifoliae TaxID=58002 RepID=UPI0021AB05A8|nr:uncharacterized protein LOC126894813 isoform X2 [Daktulosphaira vitifoliae]